MGDDEVEFGTDGETSWMGEVLEVERESNEFVVEWLGFQVEC